MRHFSFHSTLHRSLLLLIFSVVQSFGSNLRANIFKKAHTRDYEFGESAHTDKLDKAEPVSQVAINDATPELHAGLDDIADAMLSRVQDVFGIDQAEEAYPNLVKGATVTVVPDRKVYRKLCNAEGIMAMLKGGEVCKVIEVSRDGTVLVGDEDWKYWVPIRALVGFEDWGLSKGNAAREANTKRSKATRNNPTEKVPGKTVVRRAAEAWTDAAEDAAKKAADAMKRAARAVIPSPQKKNIVAGAGAAGGLTAEELKKKTEHYATVAKVRKAANKIFFNVTDIPLVTITRNQMTYYAASAASGVMPMLPVGSKGKIKDMDNKKKTALIVNVDGDESWVPVSALIGFETAFKRFQQHRRQRAQQRQDTSKATAQAEGERQSKQQSRAGAADKAQRAQKAAAKQNGKAAAEGKMTAAKAKAIRKAAAAWQTAAEKAAEERLDRAAEAAKQAAAAKAAAGKAAAGRKAASAKDAGQSADEGKASTKSAAAQKAASQKAADEKASADKAAADEAGGKNAAERKAAAAKARAQKVATEKAGAKQAARKKAAAEAAARKNAAEEKAKKAAAAKQIADAKASVDRALRRAAAVKNGPKIARATARMADAARKLRRARKGDGSGVRANKTDYADKKKTRDAVTDASGGRAEDSKTNTSRAEGDKKNATNATQDTPVDIASLTRTWPQSDFVASGCRSVSADSFKFSLEGFMSLNRCFTHCRKVAGMKYFATSKGKQCMCSETPPGKQSSMSNCDQRCTGSGSEICGGAGGFASVYTMIDCNGKSTDQKRQRIAGRTVQLVESYDGFEGEACGASISDHSCELDGSSKFAGSLDECKIACWQARGAEICHAFTYDSIEERCYFHTNVADKKRFKKATLACYFKKTHYQLNWSEADAKMKKKWNHERRFRQLSRKN